MSQKFSRFCRHEPALQTKIWMQNSILTWETSSGAKLSMDFDQVDIKFQPRVRWNILTIISSTSVTTLEINMSRKELALKENQ